MTHVSSFALFHLFSYIRTLDCVISVIGNTLEDNTDTKIYEISFRRLMDYALKEKNNIAYNLAIYASNKYEQQKLNQYITTGALILLCFDIN